MLECVTRASAASRPWWCMTGGSRTASATTTSRCGTTAARRVRGSGARTCRTGATSTTRQPAYTIVDANVAYAWKLNTMLPEAKIQLQAENPLDNRSVAYGYMHREKNAPSCELAQDQPPLLVGLTLRRPSGRRPPPGRLRGCGAGSGAVSAGVAGRRCGRIG